MMSTIAKQLDEPLLPSNAKKWFVYFVACRSMMAEPLETGEQKDVEKNELPGFEPESFGR